jgi:pilus assembly protein Flp/PilA
LTGVLAAALVPSEAFAGPGVTRNHFQHSEKRSNTKMIKSFLRDESGLELSEYAVAAALVALAVVTVFTTLGKNISGVINNLASYIK